MGDKCKSPWCNQGYIKLYDSGRSYWVRCPECGEDNQRGSIREMQEDKSVVETGTQIPRGNPDAGSNPAPSTKHEDNRTREADKERAAEPVLLTACST